MVAPDPQSCTAQHDTRRQQWRRSRRLAWSSQLRMASSRANAPANTRRYRAGNSTSDDSAVTAEGPGRTRRAENATSPLRGRPVPTPSRMGIRPHQSRYRPRADEVRGGPGNRHGERAVAKETDWPESPPLPDGGGFRDFRTRYVPLQEGVSFCARVGDRDPRRQLPRRLGGQRARAPREFSLQTRREAPSMKRQTSQGADSRGARARSNARRPRHRAPDVDGAPPPPWRRREPRA